MADTGRSVAGRYWSLHTHTVYSANDAMTPVEAGVTRAHELGHPAICFTDHGNLAHVVKAYRAAQKVGIAYGPGVEMYLTPVHEAREQRSMHLTMAAYTTQGYYNLVSLNNQAHDQFYYRPRLDMADLAQAAEDGRTQGIAIATGCRSGPVVRALTERGPAAARQVAAALAGWFPRAYVELMDHGFTADGMWDRDIVIELENIAKELGLPCILTGDSHYLFEEDQQAHDALKTLVSWSADPDEGKFSGKGYWLLEHHQVDPSSPGWEGLDDLAPALKVKIPELDTFKACIPDVTLTGRQKSVLGSLVMAAWEKAKARFSVKQQKVYEQRIKDELAVIYATGMEGYLLLVEMICSWMEAEGIWYYARGSVAGSLVCYLLGISNTDPVFWNIRMDRFLSGDRTSLPDIDLDIEHERRKELMTMLEGKGYEIIQVGTQAFYGLSKKEDEDGTESGSLLVKYFSTLKKQGDSETTWETAPQADKDTLFDLANRGLFERFGMHPGGVVLAQGKPDLKVLPLARIGKDGNTVTAFNKGEVEELGFPKIDLLGSKVLTALKNASMAITELDTFGAREWWRQLPLDDKPTMQRVAKGKTTGLFQLGGWTQRKGLEQLKPRKTIDIVAGQALFRPAPMKSGFTDEFFARREKRKPIPEMHEDIAAETADTYGLAIYQEQVVGILRRLGVEPIPLTKLLKAVKASGKAHVVEAKKIVADAVEWLKPMAEKKGWSPDDWAYLHGCLVDYGAGYSFGKAHSVTYGKAAYDTAYLATNYPLEWWTGLLNAYVGSKNSQGESLEPLYRRGAREDDIRVRDPHVLHSGVHYTFDRKERAILQGLTAVARVGEGVATELVAKRPYESLQDLFQRASGKITGAKDLVTLPKEEYGAYLDAHPTTVIACLHDAGALKGLTYGTPIRKAKGRKRKCEPCKITFPTPLDYEIHLEETPHDDPE